MTITQDATRYPNSSYATVESGPLFSGIDILGGILAIVMILGPLTAAGTHASHQGWPTQQSETR